MLWGLLWPFLDLHTGSGGRSDTGLRTLLWENFGNMILQLVGGLPRGYGIWLYHKSASRTHLFCFCLYVISCRGSFMVGFQSFWSMVVQQIVVILVFSWEEVSLRSFYSTILVSLPSRFFLMQLLHLLLFCSGVPGLPVQRTWAWSLVWEDSTCHGASKPMCYKHSG